MSGFGLKFKKGDLWAVLFVMALIAVLFLLFAAREKGGYAVVTIDGRETARLPLSRDTEFSVSGKYHAVIAVEKGEAFVKTSDCPHGDCVKSGKISKNGQSIVCLPGRMTVTVEGEGVDAVIG